MGLGREFRILGPLEALEDGRQLDLGGLRQRAVLALLLLRSAETISAERLIEDVWAGEPPDGAANTLQSYVSRLRRELGRETIATRPGGYAFEPGSCELDLHRFERLTDDARGLPPAAAAERLTEALALWRGPPLGEFAYEPWAQAPIARLEELRLAVIERRIEAELELGRHAELVAELGALVGEHPLRERLCELRMLALYRSGRQAEALEAYRATRTILVDEVGIEPGPALRDLESAILRQAPELDGPAATPVPIETPRTRSILVVATSDAAILPLVSIAEPLARHPPRELIVIRLLQDANDAAGATVQLAGLRDELVGRGLQMRVAAFTSGGLGEDVARLARELDVDLALLDAPESLLDSGVLDAEFAAVLRDVVSDVALLVPGRSLHRETTRPVVVPFGGAEHDWTAVELAAWIAHALGTKLKLVGTSADRLRRSRDASRLLGRASLVVQAVVGVVAEPVLVRRGAEGILETTADAAVLIVGLSGRWHAEGLGQTRLEVARVAGVPTLLVRRGLRPGGLAPSETMTRFTWTLGPVDA
jgi:DNA-binding SARP family transcriptional activator